MYEIIAMTTKYILAFVIYLFIFRIAKLIYQDIKTMTVWEESKERNPHLKLLSSMERAGMKTVTEIFPIKNQNTVIGRSFECEVVIADPHISSKHVSIEKANQGFIINDLGSVNGTYVNGVRLLNPAVLREGDEIMIGVTKLLFSEGERHHG